jgi:hypothetical protein
MYALRAEQIADNRFGISFVGSVDVVAIVSIRRVIASTVAL